MMGSVPATRPHAAPEPSPTWPHAKTRIFPQPPDRAPRLRARPRREEGFDKPSHKARPNSAHCSSRYSSTAEYCWWSISPTRSARSRSQSPAILATRSPTCPGQLIDRIFTALEEQTVTVPVTRAVEGITPASPHHQTLRLLHPRRMPIHSRQQTTQEHPLLLHPDRLTHDPPPRPITNANTPKENTTTPPPSTSPANAATPSTPYSKTTPLHLDKQHSGTPEQIRPCILSCVHR